MISEPVSTAQKPRSNFKLALKIILPALVSIFCLAVAARNVQLEALSAILKSASYAPIFLGMTCSLVSFFLRARRWQTLLKPFHLFPTERLFRWQVGGLFINNIAPMRLGDFFRGYWCGHKSALPKSSVLATIVVERVLDVISIATISAALLGFRGIYHEGTTLNPLRIFILISAIGLTLTLALIFIKLNLHQKLLTYLKTKLPQNLAELMDSFLSGLKIIEDKKALLNVAAYSFLIWAVDITVLMIVSYSLHLNLSWTQAGVTIIGLVLGVMIPAAPGAAGTYEAGGVSALAILGFNSTLAFSFMILLHTSQFLFVMCIGIPILILEGFNPKELFNNFSNKR